MLFLLLMSVVFLAIFAEPLSSDGHEHSCTEQHCPVCLKIEIARGFLKLLILAGIVLLSSGCLTYCVGISKSRGEYKNFTLSPVALKVRFNS